MAKFSELPHTTQSAISNNTFDVEPSELSDKQRTELNALTPNELFKSYLEWNGIIGYSSSIHYTHELIFGKSS